MRSVILSIFILICLLLSNPAFAIKQYRCNGRVQYRPCEQEVDRRASVRQDSSGKARWAPGKQKSNIPPRVFDDTFERSSGNQGIWRGHVAGDGVVYLKLYIYEKGSLVLTREIGSVELRGESTYFAFESMLPKGDKWTWVIKASY